MFHESLMIRWENLFWGLQKPKSTLSERCLMLYPEHMFMHLWTQLQARIYFILFVSFFKKCWQWPNEVFLQPIGSVDENNQLLFSFSVMSNSLQHRGLHTPGFLVLHCLPKFAQTHVHWVSETIQPSHPLFSPFPPALSLSQHQGLFQWVGSLHQVAKVLELQLQHQSF